MKKILAVLLTVCLTLSLMACANNQTQESSQTAQESSEEASKESSSASESQTTEETSAATEESSETSAEAASYGSASFDASEYDLLYTVVCDSSLTLSDPQFDQYFEGTAEEGIKAITAAGRVYINGKQLPYLQADGTPSADSFSINGEEALWQVDGGWAWQIHLQRQWNDGFFMPRVEEGYSAGTPVDFDWAVYEITRYTTYMVGQTVELYALKGETTASAIATNFYGSTLAADLKKEGGKVTLYGVDGSEFDIVFDEANFDEAIQAEDMLVYWLNENDEWVAKRAYSQVGKLVENTDTTIDQADHHPFFREEGSEELIGTEDSYIGKSFEEAFRHTQFIRGERRTDQYNYDGEYVIMWSSDELPDHVIGFTRGDSAKDALAHAVEYAEEVTKDIVISEDGAGVAEGTYWVPQATWDAFEEQLNAAKAMLEEGSASNLEYDTMTFELGNVLGGGEDLHSTSPMKMNPYGIVGLVQAEQEGMDVQELLNPSSGGGSGNEGGSGEEGESSDENSASSGEEQGDEAVSDETVTDGTLTVFADGTAAYKVEPEQRDADFDGEFFLAKYLGEDVKGAITSLISEGKVLYNGMALEDPESGLETITGAVKSAGTQITLNLENSAVTSMEIFKTSGMLVDHVEEKDGVVVAYVDKETPFKVTQGFGPDAVSIDVTFLPENVGEIVEGGIAVYWEAADGYHLEMAEARTGKLTDGADHKYYVLETTDGETINYDPADMYSRGFSAGNRPGQFINTQNYMELNDIEVTVWSIPGTIEAGTPMPIGITGLENASARLEGAVEFTENILAMTVVAESAEEAATKAAESGLTEHHWVREAVTVDHVSEVTGNDSPGVLDMLNAKVAEAKDMLSAGEATYAELDEEAYELFIAMYGSSSDIGAVFSGTTEEGFFDVADDGANALPAAELK